jgi:hypothetical protein
MFYTLVLILLSGGNVNATVYSIHDRMDDCFKARNEILIKGNHMNGFFPENTQAVCIRTSVGNIK